MIEQILFILHISWILFSEGCLFLVIDREHESIGRLSHRLANANILYVKVFQSIALNYGWINNRTNSQLLRFTDNAPWSAKEIDKATLRYLAGLQGLTFDPEYGIDVPMNSGMISLVFKAYNSNNEPIIIKIKRLDIENRLNKAIDNLLFCVNCLACLPYIRHFKIGEIVKKTIDSIRFQIDFKEEVQNMVTIRNNCAGLKYIKIPRVYEEVTQSCSDVIMMEYVQGVDITQVDKSDYEEYAKLFYKFALITIFVHGMTHGDLHCGNVLFIKDENDATNKYKLGILDFGIVYKIDDKFKESLLEIAVDMFQISPPPSPTELAKKALLSGTIEPMEVLQKLSQEDYDKIVKIASDIFEDVLHDKEKTRNLQLYVIITRLYSYMSQNNMLELGLRPGHEFMKVEMVLAMAHGVTMTLCDNHIEMTEKIINELFKFDIMNDDE